PLLRDTRATRQRRDPGTGDRNIRRWFSVVVTGPGSPYLSVVYSPLHSPNLGDHQTSRLDLPASGWYKIDVAGASSPQLLSELGPYRLALMGWNTATETAPSALVPGDSVTTEAIDFSADWDDFVVTATPGEDLGLI